MKSGRRDNVLLLLILLAGTALRLVRLGADSLWYDETVSVFLAGSPTPELIRHTAGDIHPPGYYLLLRGWLNLLGYSTGRADPTGHGLEFVAGFFSLAFGVLLIALVYALARRVAGRPTALIAAGLLAFSPYNIWYSQEVRMYTLAAALGVIVLYALLQAGLVADRRPEQSPPLGQAAGDRRLKICDLSLATPHSAFRIPHSAIWWAVYTIAAAAGMYTLYYFAFLLLALNVWAFATLAQSAIRNPQSAIPNPQSPIPNPQSAIRHPPSAILPWLLANAGVVLLYTPWIPVAWRQATAPPVPPWRTAPALLTALRESWTALSLGQSAPGWLWPVLLLTLGLYIAGLIALAASQVSGFKSQVSGLKSHASPCHEPRTSFAGLVTLPPCRLVILSSFPLATFGSLALILIASAITPLYHVRYLFTYSPAFYVVLAAGLGWLWRKKQTDHSRSDPSGFGKPEGSGGHRPFGFWETRRVWSADICRVLAVFAALAWLAAVGVTLHAFWTAPPYRPDDHRAAARFLQEQWRPGDVVLVNAGYAYTALLTYWDGPVAFRGRLTGDLPNPRGDAGLVLLTTGHVDGAPDLGWADPRSDFFAMPAAVAERQLAGLFDKFPRVWHYRIYDTVNDPQGRIRAWLEDNGQLFDDRVFAGEACMRVQGFAPRRTPPPDLTWPAATFGGGLTLRGGPLPGQIAAGETLYPVVTWEVTTPTADFATSVRLIGPEGAIWAQPPDEQPLGPLFLASSWPTAQPEQKGGPAALRQPLALPVPIGTPPGVYTVELVVYDPTTGWPWPARLKENGMALTANGVALGQINVVRPVRFGAPGRVLARFGPLALLEANSPATVVAAGGQVPIELLWQAGQEPGEPLVVVLQLLNDPGQVVAGLEAQPLDGRYPTQRWLAGEIVRDRHTLVLPADLPAGEYRLIVGLYRAADRTRFTTRAGLFGTSDHIVIKTLTVMLARE